MPISLFVSHVSIDMRQRHISTVGLRYVNRNLETITLWSGEHPYLILKEFEYKFNIEFSNGKNDVSLILEEAITGAVRDVLSESEIIIGKGKGVRDKIGWYDLDVNPIKVPKGIVFPSAAAYQSHFL